MYALMKICLWLILLGGATCAQSASTGMNGYESGWFRHLGSLSGSVAGADLKMPERALVGVRGSGSEMANYRYLDMARGTSMLTTGSRPEAASVPTPGALGLFVTAILGAGVIARKKLREHKHEALGSE